MGTGPHGTGGEVLGAREDGVWASSCVRRAAAAQPHSHKEAKPSGGGHALFFWSPVPGLITHAPCLRVTRTVAHRACSERM